MLWLFRNNKTVMWLFVNNHSCFGYIQKLYTKTQLAKYPHVLYAKPSNKVYLLFIKNISPILIG